MMIRLTPVQCQQWGGALTQNSFLHVKRSRELQGNILKMAKLATGKVINWEPDPIQGHLKPRGRCDSVNSGVTKLLLQLFFLAQKFSICGFSTFQQVWKVLFSWQHPTRAKGEGHSYPLARKGRGELKKKNPTRSGLVWLNLSMVELHYITESLGIVNQSSFPQTAKRDPWSSASSNTNSNMKHQHCLR